MNKWTDESIKLVETLYKDGITYAEIARQLGKTRSAVAGIVARHKIKRQLKPKAAKPIKEKIIKPKIKIGQAVSSNAGVSGYGITLSQCRWPLWGNSERPNHRYCGKPVFRGVYCKTCHDVAFLKDIRKLDINYFSGL